MLPELRAVKPAKEEYEVEGIVGHRFDKSKRSLVYLVRWAGYGPSHDSWQTSRDLRNAPDILHEYRKKAGLS